MTRAQRITAARYLRLFGSAANLAVILDVPAEMRRALDPVDLVECRELAAALDDENEQYVPTRRGLLAVWEQTMAPRGEVIPLPGGYSVRVPVA